jgi:maltose alpha-D-glucosyltransferase/alpha-amylase
VIATKGAKVKTPVEQYDMLRSLREFLQWRQGNAIILAEANVLPETDMEYFGKDGDRMHMMFNFHVNQNLFYAIASADSRPLAKALAATKPRPASAQWGLFLRNHDELDLGRLTKAVHRTTRRIHRKRQALFTRHRRRPLRLRAHQCRQAAPRSQLDAELDRAHHPNAQGSAGDRLG